MAFGSILTIKNFRYVKRPVLFRSFWLNQLITSFVKSGYLSKSYSLVANTIRLMKQSRFARKRPQLMLLEAIECTRFPLAVRAKQSKMQTRYVFSALPIFWQYKQACLLIKKAVKSTSTTSTSHKKYTQPFTSRLVTVCFSIHNAPETSPLMNARRVYYENCANGWYLGHFRWTRRRREHQNIWKNKQITHKKFSLCIPTLSSKSTQQYSQLEATQSFINAKLAKSHLSSKLQRCALKLFNKSKRLSYQQRFNSRVSTQKKQNSVKLRIKKIKSIPWYTRRQVKQQYRKRSSFYRLNHMLKLAKSLRFRSTYRNKNQPAFIYNMHKWSDLSTVARLQRIASWAFKKLVTKRLKLKVVHLNAPLARPRFANQKILKERIRNKHIRNRRASFVRFFLRTIIRKRRGNNKIPGQVLIQRLSRESRAEVFRNISYTKQLQYIYIPYCKLYNKKFSRSRAWWFWRNRGNRFSTKSGQFTSLKQRRYFFYRESVIGLRTRLRKNCTTTRSYTKMRLLHIYNMHFKVSSKSKMYFKKMAYQVQKDYKYSRAKTYISLVSQKHSAFRMYSLLLNKSDLPKI